MARRTADEINADVSSYQQQLQALNEKAKAERAAWEQSGASTPSMVRFGGVSTDANAYNDPYIKKEKT